MKIIIALVIDLLCWIGLLTALWIGPEIMIKITLTVLGAGVILGTVTRLLLLCKDKREFGWNS